MKSRQHIGQGITQAVALVAALLLAAGANVQSAPAASLDRKPVDSLVAAAQTALQRTKDNVTGLTTDDVSDVDRHRGASFTSPVDGYFIQARHACSCCTVQAQLLSPKRTHNCLFSSRSALLGLCLSLDNTKNLALWCRGIKFSQS